MENLEPVDYDFAFYGEKIRLALCKVCKNEFYYCEDVILNYCPCCGREIK